MITPRERKRIEKERKVRRVLFFTTLFLSGGSVACFLLYKLSALLLPILVGAVLAYLFRPLKNMFQVSWLPHEAHVLLVFGLTAVVLFSIGNKARQMIPDDREKLELKVRLKYKLNEKYLDFMGRTVGEKASSSNPLMKIVANEIDPMMNHMNDYLSLAPEEQELFEKYRKGFKGQPPIDEKYYRYYMVNLTRNPYAKDGRAPATVVEDKIEAAHEGHESENSKGLIDALSVWILAPIIFIFMAFDTGQMRKYTMSLVPNRYFELTLTVLDMLDDAIGKYLRGTLLECTLVGLTLAIGLFLLGLPLPVALGIGAISGFVNCIPFLGTVIGLIIALGYTLIAENIDPLIPGLVAENLTVYVVILIGIAHVLDNVVFQPFVLGSAVNLHPLVVFTAIIGGSTLMGLLGMLIAIPTVVIVKTAVETLVKELKAYRII
jgi:predicted PurR-regulated permease PerM